jgi:hypothetical protein
MNLVDNGGRKIREENKCVKYELCGKIKETIIFLYKKG